VTVATPIPYNAKSLPFYQQESGANDSTVSPDVSHGYDIFATRLSEERRSVALARANGTLSNSRERVIFFVTDVKVDLSLTGTTGQGRRTRDFYPHNVLMPGYTISAMCLDQQDYGTVVEFVHKTQQEAVGNARAGNLIQLDIAEGGLHITTPQGEPVSFMRGVHKPICAQGVIMQIQRKHKQFEYAPKFEMQVIVSHEFTGLYKEVGSFEPEQESWWALLQGLKPWENQKKEQPAVNTKPTTAPSPLPAPAPSTNTAKGREEQAARENAEHERAAHEAGKR